MNFRVKIGDETYSAEAERLDASGSTVIRLGGASRSVTVASVSPNHLFLRVDGEPFNLFVAPVPEGAWIWSDGRARFGQDADKVDRRRSRGPGESPRLVTPPTPASVVKVMATVGQVVDKGTPLVVVSAMKMEITLSAPFSGRVVAVNTEVGAQVRPGEVLVDIEPLPKEENGG
jgi:biotin carboxyl carrier protein